MLNELSSIVSQYKDTIWLILTWFAGSVTHIFNKVRKGEKMSFWQHFSHIIISWFVWYMAWLICSYLWINPWATHIIVGSSAYLWIQIMDAVEMIKAKTIYNLILDFITFKLWWKK